MDVFCDDAFAFTLDEDVAGWYVFNRRLAAAFPQTKDWEMEIASPAFEPMLRNIYDRDGRTYAEAKALAATYEKDQVLK